MAVSSSALPIKALVVYIQTLANAIDRGVGKAMLEATEIAYAGAVRAAKANFNNTPGRVRTGQLMNAIYRGFDPSSGQGFVGVRSPYGAIQEFGGTVHPINAKHLWVKNYVGVDNRFKRWLPRDFMAAREADPSAYPIFKSPHTGRMIAAYQARGAGPAQMQALFSLVDSVTLPSRPYVRPAVAEAYAKLSELTRKHIAEERK